MALGKIHADHAPELTKRFEVLKIPMMFYLKNGLRNDYKGKIDRTSLISWASKRTVELIQEQTCDELEKSRE